MSQPAERARVSARARNPMAAASTTAATMKAVVATAGDAADAVAVDVECGVERFSIAMAPADYTALRSWSESAPPGPRSQGY